MATGNSRVRSFECKACNSTTKFERNGMIWGMGDFILVLLTAGLWIVLRLIMNAVANPWRCSGCGKRK